MIEVRAENAVNAARRVGVVAERVASLHPALHAAVEVQTADLLRVVVEEKLSGQVLQVRSGTLRRSITAEVTDEGDTIRGVVGTNVIYAAIHEYGGTIAHPGGTPYYLDRNGTAHFVSLRNSLARTLPRTRPHAIPMPERSFLRSALADQEGTIHAAIQTAAVQHIRGSVR